VSIRDGIAIDVGAIIIEKLALNAIIMPTTAHFFIKRSIKCGFKNAILIAIIFLTSYVMFV